MESRAAGPGEATPPDQWEPRPVSAAATALSAAGVRRPVIAAACTHSPAQHRRRGQTQLYGSDLMDLMMEICRD